MEDKKAKKFLKKYGVMFIGILCTILFLYSDCIFGDYQISFTNLMYQSAPWNTLGVETAGPVLSDVIDSFTPELYTTITDGTIGGLWDPDIALGAESNISSWMYPLNYLYLLPLNIATILRITIEFAIGFLGMYLFLRSLNCRKFPSAIAGVTYCFSSVIVMWLGWQHSDVAAFAPLAFFFFERFLQTVKIKYCFGIAITVYLMLVAGMPTYAAYFLYLLAAYVFFRTIWIYRKEKKKIFIIFAATFLAVLLGVICSLPYTGNLLSSVGGNGYAESRAGRASNVLSWEYIASLFLPYVRIETGQHMNESTIYIGLAAILLLFFSFLNFKKKKNSKFWLISLAIVFLLIFTHAFDKIYAMLPAINTSSKTRIITLFNFAAVIIMGLNLGDLTENREYYLKRKLKYIVALILGSGALAAGFFWIYSVKKGQGYGDDFWTYLVTAGIIIAALLLFLIKKIPTNVIMGLLCAVVIFNMGSFAKNYFPLVEKDAGDIPEATDTIEYLQDNTEYERVAATGMWTLFPNTYVYYGLDDVRGHNFVFTNEDMRTYYTALSGEDNGFHSATRFALLTDVNENLLGYLGTKYLVETNINSGDYMTPGPVYEGIQLVQEVTLDADSPKAISMTLATYQNVYQEGDCCYLTVTEKNTGEEVYQAQYDMREFEDNSSYTMQLGQNALEKDVPYLFAFTTNTPADRAMTFYLDKSSGQEQKAFYNGSDTDAVLTLQIIEQQDRVMEDGLTVHELESYTDRVELADSVEIYQNAEEILERMEDSYDKNTVFIEESEAEKLSSLQDIRPLTEEDRVEITEHADDSVTVEVTADSPKILMLNEYYDPDWKVYIDGEEQELIKCNYLFRGVEIPEGTSTVEFRYEPVTLYILFAVCFGGAAVIVVLAVFSGKIQKRIDRKKSKRG